MMTPRRFPIQSGRSSKLGRRLSGGTIPWDVAEKAYAAYARRFGDRQSLERLGERGGFGRAECAWLLAGAPRDESLLATDPADVILPGYADDD